MATCNGTGIAWNAYRGEWSGIARVYLDGEEKATIDTPTCRRQGAAFPTASAAWSSARIR
jgi:hypothetical protein